MVAYCEDSAFARLIMESLIEYCKATTKEIRAYADSLNLDRMTQESFIKMIPKDMNKNTPSCSWRGSGDPVDELDSENNTKKEIDLGEKRLDAAEYEEKDVCEGDDGHFIPRKLLLFKVEKFKNERDGRHRVRKSTKTFRAPVPNCPHSAAEEGPWIGDNGSRQVIRKSTKTFRAPDPKSTRSTPAEHLEVPNTKPEQTSPSFRCRVKKFFGFR